MFGLGALFIYFLLLLMLVMAEKGAEGASISSLLLAFWYSVTTLTTVGYGDTYPVTVFGRLIGLIFQLMSLGVLVAVLSLILQLVQGKLLPILKLAFSHKKIWYVFPVADDGALALAGKLREKEADCVIVLPREAKAKTDASLQAVFTDLSPAFLCEKHPNPEKVHVFFLSENSFENEKNCTELLSAGCRTYCLSEREPEKIPDRMVCFHPEESKARLYWHRYPVVKTTEKIVLVGGGRGGRALLEQALMLNVISPEQRLQYTLCGDWSEFQREHPYLNRFLSLSTEAEDRDVLIIAEGPWNRNWEIFRTADRIIFCDDEEQSNAENAADLLRFCPVQGKIYAALSYPMDAVICYGSLEELYTPELVMGRELNRLAIRMHESYRASSGGSLPDWNGLGSFLRRSNLASADHLSAKARILLGPDADKDPEKWKKAAACYRELSVKEKDRCRRIEHERWNRFHLLNNWQYGPVRDNAARIHPMILPFDQLSERDQAKDDYAWELLSQVAD